LSEGGSKSESKREFHIRLRRLRRSKRFRDRRGLIEMRDDKEFKETLEVSGI